MLVKTKYQIKDSAFVMYENRIIPIKICGIRILVTESTTTISYISDIATAKGGVPFLEDKVFKTKEELLKSL